jgi:hypothetical protein
MSKTTNAQDTYPENTDVDIEPGEGGARGPQLLRGVGLASATRLNMIDMIGVGSSSPYR